MRRKFLFFINPVSGTADKTELESKIVKKCLEYRAGYHFAETSSKGLYPHLAEQLITDHITDIVICGGDGSLSPVIASQLGNDINFGIIPLGSGNGLALAAKIPRVIEKALDVVFTGKPVPVDAFLINGRLSCMLSGIGFDAQVAYDFSTQKKRGLNTYIVQAVKNFVSASPFPFVVEVNGNRLETNAFFICIANGNQFGNNFTIAPEASLSDGLLDIIIVKEMAKLKMLWAVMQQMNEGKLVENVAQEFDNRNVIYLQANELVIYNHESAPLHIDGDPAETSEKIEIKILPGAFKLIQPNTRE